MNPMVGPPLAYGELLYLQAGRINPAAKVASQPRFPERGRPADLRTSMGVFAEFSEPRGFGHFGVELRLSLSLGHYNAINRDKDLTESFGPVCRVKESILIRI